MHVTVRRPQKGLVVDAKTENPVPGARVVIESWQFEAPPGDVNHRWLLHTTEVKTDASGSWQVDEEKDWKWAILAADGFPAFKDSACVLAPGYQPAIVNPWRLEGSSEPDRKVRDEMLGTKIPGTFRLLSGAGTIPSGKGTSTCGIPLKAPRQ